MDLSQTEYAHIYEYCPSTGGLVWKIDVGQRARKGTIAGSLFKQKKSKTDYWITKYRQERCFAHRVVWIMAYGPIPDGFEIDHKDGNGLNNRLGNLRLVTHSEQNKNQPRRDDNKTGVVGIFRLENGNYIAYVNSDGKRIHLGTHKKIECAIAARQEAERTYDFHCNHGR